MSCRNDFVNVSRRIISLESVKTTQNRPLTFTRREEAEGRREEAEGRNEEGECYRDLTLENQKVRCLIFCVNTAHISSSVTSWFGTEGGESVLGGGRICTGGRERICTGGEIGENLYCRGRGGFGRQRGWTMLQDMMFVF